MNSRVVVSIEQAGLFKNRRLKNCNIYEGTEQVYYF